MKKASLSLLTLALMVGLSISVIAQEEELPLGNAHGLNQANFDDSCKPCKDFYQYANGGWLANYPIPEAYSSWGISSEMSERNNILLKQILSEAAEKTDTEAGRNWQLVGDLFYSAMDTAAIEAAGAEPLQAAFDEIDALNSIDQLLTLVGNYHAQGQDCMFSIQPEQDLKDNTRYIIYAGQGGLGLPDRDYYTKVDDESVSIRQQYVEHLTNMFALMRQSPEVAQAAAEAIMAIETRLAQKSVTRTEMRNPEQWMDFMAVADANAITPNIDWAAYLKTIGQPQMDSISLTQAGFFAELNLMLDEVSLADWKLYLKWNVLTRAAPYLSNDFVDEDFRFFSTVLRGTKKLRPRWKRVLGSMNFTIGEALGQLYVERAFPPATKVRAQEMITNVIAALRGRLQKLPWMGDETRAKALAKLATFTPKIGYPDKWRDYTGLEINRGAYVLNLRRARAFETQRQFNKIGKPVDKDEWGMPPQIVNAYYNPLLNEVVFPAGIMQPPFFDGETDDAINYGAMGAVIGHEIMHGFDDQGSRFDAEGNMVNWWTDEDRAGFEARTAKIISQFDQFIPIDSMTINGSLTQGENIGDLGGLQVALGGLMIAREGKEDPMIDGFTQEQRFFLSWAQGWRRNLRDKSLKLQINTDPHSPAKYRVIGPFQNLPEFHKAFNCQEGDYMVAPADKFVEIW